MSIQLDIESAELAAHRGDEVTRAETDPSSTSYAQHQVVCRLP